MQRDHGFEIVSFLLSAGADPNVLNKVIKKREIQKLLKKVRKTRKRNESKKLKEQIIG